MTLTKTSNPCLIGMEHFLNYRAGSWALNFLVGFVLEIFQCRNYLFLLFSSSFCGKQLKISFPDLIVNFSNILKMDSILVCLLTKFNNLSLQLHYANLHVFFFYRSQSFHGCCRLLRAIASWCFAITFPLWGSLLNFSVDISTRILARHILNRRLCF